MAMNSLDRVGFLARPVPPIEVTAAASLPFQRFGADADLQTIAVLNDDRVVGLIVRRELPYRPRFSRRIG